MVSALTELMCTIVLGSTEIVTYVSGQLNVKKMLFGILLNTSSVAACALQSLLFIRLQIRGKESPACFVFPVFFQLGSGAPQHPLTPFSGSLGVRPSGFEPLTR